MDKKYRELWWLAKPYLKRGKMKDFVLHTKGVIEAMEMLLQKEQGDSDILIPAAMLHDVGWAKVPKKLQKSHKPEEKQQALVLHLKYGGLIIQQILGQLSYPREKITQIVDIVIAHKFQDPTELDKRLLIDADAVADALSDQFKSDLKSYKVTAQQLYNFRKKNDFYTASAKEIFARELEQRKRECNLS